MCGQEDVEFSTQERDKLGAWIVIYSNCRKTVVWVKILEPGRCVGRSVDTLFWLLQFCQ